MSVEVKNISIKDITAPIRFGEVIFDEAGAPNHISLKEVPFSPFQDEDLAGKPLVERARLLKEMQTNYWLPVFKESSPLLFEEERSDSLRLTSILFDLEMKDLEVRYAENQVAETSRQFKEEKTDIRGEGGREEEIQQKIDAAGTKWTPKIKSAKQRKEAQETLHDTVLDIFVKDFFLSEKGLERLYLAIDDVIAHTAYTEQNIVALLTKAQNRLQRLRSEEHALFFGYKTNSDNLTSPENAAILQQIIQAAFQQRLGKKEKGKQVERQVSALAKAILGFYRRNIDSLYQDEEVPLTAFSYDFFFAATLQEDPKFFLKASDWLLKRLTRPKIKQEFYTQLKVCWQKAYQEAQVLTTRLKRLHQVQGTEEDFLTFLTNPNEAIIAQFIREKQGRYIIGRHYDRIVSLESAFAFLGENGRANLYQSSSVTKDTTEEILRQARETTEVEKEQLLKAIQLGEEANYPLFVAKFWRHCLIAFDPTTLFLDGLVSNLMEKEQYLSRKAKMVGDTATREMRRGAYYASMLRELDRIPPIVRNEIATNLLIQALLVEHAPSQMQQAMEAKRENDSLLRNIRDENLWCVAPNGDCFPVELNPHLGPLQISSLIFYPDRQSRGERVVITTNITGSGGNSLSFTIFIDGNGKLFYDNRRAVQLPFWLIASLKSVILPHLHFITSGALRRESQREALFEEDIAKEREVTVVTRRNHWRVLPYPQYTLQSNEAKKHAQFVLERYGIDIYAENLRRWRSGALPRDRIITFVKEVEDPNVPPNQIAYTPLHAQDPALSLEIKL